MTFFFFFLIAGNVLCPHCAFFFPSLLWDLHRWAPPVLTKDQAEQAFPSLCLCLPPLSEAKARVLCPKNSLSLWVAMCVLPQWHSPTHLPSREAFPGCFSFLLGEILASRAVLGSSSAALHRLLSKQPYL